MKFKITIKIYRLHRVVLDGACIVVVMERLPPQT